MSDSSQILEAHALEFAYMNDQPVLRGVDFSASKGRLTCILGPNGSGKTTLLRSLLGWLKPSGGVILLDQRPLEDYSQRALARMLAYVPQIPTSTFAFPVQELILMGRFAHAGAMGLASDQDMAVATEAMKMTQTVEFAHRALSELSGGEAQCVMIARALAQQPSVMLLDEPTSHLDIKNQLKIYRLMQRLAHDWGMAVVCVSHDVNLAGRFADELVLMNKGEAIGAGPPEEIINSDVLGKAYDVEIELINSPGEPIPIVWAH